MSVSERERQAQSAMVDQYDVNVCTTPRLLSGALFKLSALSLSLSPSDSLIIVVVVDPLQSAANVSVGSENEIENITRKITENFCEKLRKTDSK